MLNPDTENVLADILAEKPKECPACGGPLRRTGIQAPNPMNHRQRLKSHGLTCEKCGLNVNSATVDFANSRWPSGRRSTPNIDPGSNYDSD